MFIPTSVISILRLAMLKRPGMITECYYMDHSDKTIFSIHAVDYFMLTEKMEIREDAQTGYTKEETNFLVNKMKKLEHNAPGLVAIPTFSFQETRSIIDYFTGLKFTHPEIETMKAEAAAFDSNLRKSLINLFDSVSDDFLKEEWEEFIHSKADEKIIAFILEENIEIQEYKEVWLGNGSITVTLRVDPDKPNSGINKTSSVFLIVVVSAFVFFMLIGLLILFGIYNGFVPP